MASNRVDAFGVSMCLVITRARLLLLIVLTSGIALAAQKPARDAASVAPATGTAAVGGVLVAADTGKPVRRARVNLLSREPRVTRSAITDTQGRFLFVDLPAGEFALSASQPGYLDVTYGQKRPGAGGLGTPIHVVDHQHVDGLSLRIPRGGVLTGTVLDDNNDPVFGAQVRAFRYVMRTGERTLEPAGTGRTDDRGSYRIPALPPGDYIVSAVPKGTVTAAAGAKAGAANKPAKAATAAAAAAAAEDPDTASPDGYAPVFYPGTAVASAAQVLTLDVSQERVGVDLQLQLVPMARIDGTLISTSGPLPTNALIELVEADAATLSKDARTARLAANGTFSFSGLAPGQYTLVARAAVPTADSALGQARAAGQRAEATARKAAKTAGELQMMWALSEVRIDGRNVANLSLTLQPGMSISGSVAFRGSKPAPTDLTRVRVAIAPVGHAPESAIATVKPVAVGADGTFTITGVVPGKYRLSVTGQTGAAGWTLAQAVAGGTDTLDSALDVRPNEDVTGVQLRLSDQQTLLSGTLQDTAGLATADYYVVVFSADQRFWTPQSRRIQATRPGTDGHFAFRNLPPGDYRVIALADVEAGAWYDPTLLRQLIGPSIAISLTENAKLVQDLRISR